MVALQNSLLLACSVTFLVACAGETPYACVCGGIDTSDFPCSGFGEPDAECAEMSASTDGLCETLEEGCVSVELSCVCDFGNKDVSPTVECMRWCSLNDDSPTVEPTTTGPSTVVSIELGLTFANELDEADKLVACNEISKVVTDEGVGADFVECEMTLSQPQNEEKRYLLQAGVSYITVLKIEFPAEFLHNRIEDPLHAAHVDAVNKLLVDDGDGTAVAQSVAQIAELIELNGGDAPTVVTLKVSDRDCDQCVQEFDDAGGCDDNTIPLGCNHCETLDLGLNKHCGRCRDCNKRSLRGLLFARAPVVPCCEI